MILSGTRADLEIHKSVAGSDSTSSALAYTFYHILNHPDVHEALTKELRTAFPSRSFTADEVLPTYSDLAKFPYLQACIKESLRLTPPATINLPRYVPEGGRLIAGKHFLPAKVRVTLDALVISY